MTSISATGIIYIRSDANIISYRINTGPQINITSLPLTITNSDTNILLKVLFENDITLSDPNWFIICDSSNIQFGSTSLKDDGTRPVITISNVSSYPGFIQNGTSNGTSITNGNSNIYVFNLNVHVINSTLASDQGFSTAFGAGWVGQAYFSISASNNCIINCSSDGPIDGFCGGIVGSYAGAQSGASLKIIGCSNSGNMQGNSNPSGGIAGYTAGRDGGNISCEYCWNTGDIGLRCGGIFSSGAGYNGTAIAKNCYNVGNIDNNSFYAGGIFGSDAGDNNGNTQAINCYNQSTFYNANNYIGGIYGVAASPNSTAVNCYSFQPIAALNNYQGTHCYAYANGTNWSDFDANAVLTGVPHNSNVGTTWVSTGINTPYKLYNMGYTPYSIVNITTWPAPDLKKTFSQTVIPGLSSSPGVPPGATYTILSGGNPTISIDSTGAIGTTNMTPNATYNIVVLNTGSYNITTFELTVSSPPTAMSNICFPEGTPILTDQGNIPIEKINPKVHTIRNKRIEGIVMTKLSDNYLVCFEKNSLGPNVPCERTLMSGNHMVVVKGGRMVMAKDFLISSSHIPMRWKNRMCFTGVHKVKHNGEPMYNVLMEKYDVMLVNNMLCETLDPSNKMTDLYHHIKYMSYERQQRVIKNFDAYNNYEKSQSNQRTAPPPPSRKPTANK